MGKSSSGRSRTGSEASSRLERRATMDDEETTSTRNGSRVESATSGSMSRRRSSRQDGYEREEYTPTPGRYSTSSHEQSAPSNATSTYGTAEASNGRNKRDSTTESSYRSVGRESKRDSAQSTSRSERPRTLDEEEEEDQGQRNASSRRESDKGRRRDSKRQSTSSMKSAKESSRALDNHDASLPQNQFPGQGPETYTQPYRPPGHAAEYYGDNGESVAFQPGVRPQPPSVIINADQAHLYTPTAEAAPPPEPSSLGHAGAAASYFDINITGDDNIQQSASSKPIRPSRQSTDPSLSGARSSPLPPGSMSGPDGAVGATGAAAEYYAGGNIHSSSYTQHDAVSSSSYQNSAPHNGYSQSTYGSLPQPPQPPQSDSNRPHYGAAAAAGLAGAAAAGYYASNHYNNQHASQAPYSQNSTQNFVLGQNQSAFPGMQAQKQKQKHTHRGPMTKLVDWFRDPNGVAQFEEYTEAIGVCKYCFDPHSSPAEAPRKHHYHSHPSTGSNRYGSSSRVSKGYRYSSSDDDKRKRSSATKKIVTGGIAGYGAAKLGEALYRQKNDFDDTYSVKSGQPLPPVYDQRNSVTPAYREEDAESTSRRTKRDSKSSRYTSTETVGFQHHDSASSRKSRRDETDYNERKYSTRRRESSASPSRLSRGAAMSIGAGAVGAAGMAAASRRRSRSRSRSRDRSPTVRRKKSYYSKRISPRHSYVDLSTKNTGPLGFGGFFSSPSANEKKGKRPKGFFTLRNDSSSSSDADLAFGEGTVRRKTSRKDGRRRESGDGIGGTAAILGLAATGAALAAESDRRQDKRRSRRDTNDHYTGRDSRRVTPAKIKLEDHETASDVNDEGVWEDASDDESLTGSIDTALAYGGRLSARTSRESLAEQGTSKWAWRWNKNKEKKGKDRRQNEPYYQPHPQDTYDQISAGMASSGPITTPGDMTSNTPSTIQSTPLPPMQWIDPMPASSPSVNDTRKVSMLTDGPSPHTIVSRSPIPLKQPQANTAPTFAAMPEVLNKLEADAQLTDSPTEISPDIQARYAREESQERTRPQRRNSSPPLINPSTSSRQSVTWQLTDEQIANERRAAEKEQRRRSRREEKGRRQSSEPKDISVESRPASDDIPRHESLDKRAAREAEIEKELQALYAEHERQMKEQRTLDEYRRSHGEVGGIAAAIVGAGVGAAATAMLDDRKKSPESDNDKTSRRRSSLKKSSKDQAASPPRAESPPAQSQQERIARMAAQRAKSTPSPVHDDYQTFFVPQEIAEHVKEHNAESEKRQESRPVNVITIDPDDSDESPRQPRFEPFLYRPYGSSTKHDPNYHPRGVPILDLIEATPPGSRSSSVRRDSSPPRREKPQVEDEANKEPVDRRASSVSKVNWGDNSTHVFEVETPEYERKDPLIGKSDVQRTEAYDNKYQDVSSVRDQASARDANEHVLAKDEDLASAQVDPEAFKDDASVAHERGTVPAEADVLWDEGSKKSKDKKKKKRKSLVDDGVSPKSSTSSVKSETQKVPPVEEMTPAQREHVSLGKSFDDLPPSVSERETKDRESISAVGDSSDGFLGSQSSYKSPFAESVSDIGDMSNYTVSETRPDDREITKPSSKTSVEKSQPTTARDDHDSQDLSSKDHPMLEEDVVEKPRTTRSERRRLERALSSSERIIPAVRASESAPLPEQDQPVHAVEDVKETDHPSMPGDFGVFDYLVDDQGNQVSPEANRALEASVVSALSQKSRVESPQIKMSKMVRDEQVIDERAGEFSANIQPTLHRASTFDDLPMGTHKPTSKSDYASDPEDWERRPDKSSRVDKQISSKSDVGVSSKTAAIAGAAAGAVAVAAATTYDRNSYGAPKEYVKPEANGRDRESSPPVNAELDFYATQKEKKKKSKRESEIFDDFDDKSVASMPATKDEDRKSKRRSKRGSEIYEDDDTKSATSMPTTRDEDRKSKRKSKRDSDVFNDDDDSKSVMSTTTGDDEKRSKRRSKRDSEVYDDDTRSVTSSSTEKRRSKEKEKEKKSSGLFSSLFSSNKSDVSSSSKKSSKSVKSESRAERDRDESDDKERRRKRRSKGSEYYDDSMSIASEPARSSRHRSTSRDAESEKPMTKDSRDASVDDGFVSADDGGRGGHSGHDDHTQESFLAKGLEMPKPMVMDTPMGTDGVLGLTTERHLSVDTSSARNSTEEANLNKFEEGDLPPLPTQNAEEQAALSSSEDVELPFNVTPVTDRTRRLSSVRTGDFGSSPVVASSPTAVPLHFGRRYPVASGGSQRTTAQSSATSPLTTPRSRMQRPKSTDGKEFKPLYLVERHSSTKAVEPDIEEPLPSLPSSRTSSAHPSTEDLRGQALAQLEGVDYSSSAQVSPETSRERGRRYSHSEEYLDSRSATPVPGEKQRARDHEADIRERREKQLKYEFHSPSELLQDPHTSRDLEDDAIEDPRSGSPLPSVISTENDQDFMSAESRAASPEQEREFHIPGERQLRSRSPSRERPKRDSAVVLGLGTAVAATAAATGVVIGQSLQSRDKKETFAEPERSTSPKILTSGDQDFVPGTETKATGSSNEPVPDEKDSEYEGVTPRLEDEIPFPLASKKKSKKDKKKKQTAFDTSEVAELNEAKAKADADMSRRVSSSSVSTATPTASEGLSRSETTSDSQEPAMIPAQAAETAIEQEQDGQTRGVQQASNDEWDLPAKKSKKDRKKKRLVDDSTIIAPAAGSRDVAADGQPTLDTAAEFPLLLSSDQRPMNRSTDDATTSQVLSEQIAEAEPARDEEVTVFEEKKSKKEKKRKSQSRHRELDELPNIDVVAAKEATLPHEEDQPATAIPATDSPIELLEKDAGIETTSIAAAAGLLAMQGKSFATIEHPSNSRNMEQVQLEEDPVAQSEVVAESAISKSRGRSDSFVPTLAQLDASGNSLGAFEEAFERAVRARGLPEGVARDDALDHFLATRNNAPFVPKAGLTPVPEGTPTSVASPPTERSSNERMSEPRSNASLAPTKQSKKDKRKSKKAAEVTVEASSDEASRNRSISEVVSAKLSPDQNPFGDDFDVQDEKVTPVREDLVLEEPTKARTDENANPYGTDYEIMPEEITRDKRVGANPFGTDFETTPEVIAVREITHGTNVNNLSKEHEITHGDSQPYEAADEFAWAPISKKDKKKKKSKVLESTDLPSETAIPLEEVFKNMAKPEMETIIETTPSSTTPVGTSKSVSEADQVRDTDRALSATEILDPEPALLNEPVEGFSWGSSSKKDKKKKKNSQSSTPATESEPTIPPSKGTTQEFFDLTPTDTATETPAATEDDWTQSSSKKSKKGKKDKKRQSTHDWTEDALGPAAVIAGGAAAGATIAGILTRDKDKQNLSTAETEERDTSNDNKEYPATGQHSEATGRNLADVDAIEASQSIQDNFEPVLDRQDKKNKKKKNKSISDNSVKETKAPVQTMDDTEGKERLREMDLASADDRQPSKEAENKFGTSLEPILTSTKGEQSTQEKIFVPIPAEAEDEWAMPGKKSKKDKKKKKLPTALGLEQSLAEEAFSRDLDDVEAAAQAGVSHVGQPSEVPNTQQERDHELALPKEASSGQDDGAGEASNDLDDSQGQIQSRSKDIQEAADDEWAIPTRKASKKEKKKKKQQNFAEFEANEPSEPTTAHDNQDRELTTKPSAEEVPITSESFIEKNKPLGLSTDVTEHAASKGISGDVSHDSEQTRDIAILEEPSQSAQAQHEAETDSGIAKQPLPKDLDEQDAPVLGPPTGPSIFDRPVSMFDAIKMSLAKNAATISRAGLKKGQALGSSSGWQPWTPTKSETTIRADAGERVVDESPLKAKSVVKPVSPDEPELKDRAMTTPEPVVAPIPESTPEATSRSFIEPVSTVKPSDDDKHLATRTQSNVLESSEAAASDPQPEEDPWAIPITSKKSKKDKKKRKSGLSTPAEDLTTPAVAEHADEQNAKSVEPEVVPDIRNEILQPAKSILGDDQTAISMTKSDEIQESNPKPAESVTETQAESQSQSDTTKEVGADDYWGPMTSKKSKKDKKKRKSSGIEAAEPETQSTFEVARDLENPEDTIAQPDKSMIDTSNHGDQVSAERNMDTSKAADMPVTSEPVEDEEWAFTSKKSKKDKKKRKSEILSPAEDTAFSTEPEVQTMKPAFTSAARPEDSEQLRDIEDVKPAEPAEPDDAATTDPWTITRKPSKKDKKKTKQLELSTPTEEGVESSGFGEDNAQNLETEQSSKDLTKELDHARVFKTDDVSDTSNDALESNASRVEIAEPSGFTEHKDEEDWFTSKKVSKKDKKKRKSDTSTPFEESADAIMLTEESVHPDASAETRKEGFVEPPERQKLPNIQQDAETKAIEDEEGFGLARKTSKKDKKKKKKGQFLSLTEPEVEPETPSDTVTTSQSNELGDALHVRDLDQSSNRDGFQEDKTQRNLNEKLVSLRNHSGRELHQDSTHQDWLTDVHKNVAAFPSRPGLIEREEVNQSEPNSAEQITTLVKDGSARELHNESSNQTWLAGTRDFAAAFPSKPAETMRSEHDNNNEDLEVSKPDLVDQHMDETSVDKVGTSSEADPESEFSFVTAKKLKKDKKKGKRKSMDVEEDEKDSSAMTTRSAAAVVAATSAALVAAAMTNKHDDDSASATDKAVRSQDSKRVSDELADRSSEFSQDALTHPGVDNGQVLDSTTTSGGLKTEDHSTADYVLDDADTWAETETVETPLDEGVDSTVNDFFDDTPREMDEDTSWMKGNKKGKKGKKAKKGSISIDSSPSSDLVTPDASTLAIIGTTEERHDEQENNTRALVLEQTSIGTPQYDASTSAPATPAETPFKEQEEFQWTSSLKKGKKDKKKRKSVTWSDADTSTPATPANERTDDLFPPTQVSTKTGTREIVESAAEPEALTESVFVDEPMDVNEDLIQSQPPSESPEIPMTVRDLHTIESHQDIAEPLKTDLPTPGTEKEEFSWEPTISKKKSKKDKKKRGSVFESEESTSLEEAYSAGVHAAPYNEVTADSTAESSDFQSAKEAASEHESGFLVNKSKKDKKKKRGISLADDDEPAPKKVEVVEENVPTSALNADIEMADRDLAVRSEIGDIIDDSSKAFVSSPAHKAKGPVLLQQKSVETSEQLENLDQMGSEFAGSIEERTNPTSKSFAIENQPQPIIGDDEQGTSMVVEAEDDEWATPAQRSKKDKKKKKRESTVESSSLAPEVAVATVAVAAGAAAALRHSRKAAVEHDTETSDVFKKSGVEEEVSTSDVKLDHKDVDAAVDDLWTFDTKKSKKDKKKRQQSASEDTLPETVEQPQAVDLTPDRAIEVEPQPLATDKFVAPYEERAGDNLVSEPVSVPIDDDFWASGSSKKSKKDKKKRQSVINDDMPIIDTELPTATPSGAMSITHDAPMTDLDTSQSQLLPESRYDDTANLEHHHNEALQTQDARVKDVTTTDTESTLLSKQVTQTQGEDEELWTLPSKKSKKEKKKKMQPFAEEIEKSLDRENITEEMKLVEPVADPPLEGETPANSAVPDVADLAALNLPADDVPSTTGKKSKKDKKSKQRQFYVPDNEPQDSTRPEASEPTESSRDISMADAPSHEYQTPVIQDVREASTPVDTESTMDSEWAVPSKKLKKDKKSKRKSLFIEDEQGINAIQEIGQTSRGSVQHDERSASSREQGFEQVSPPQISARDLHEAPSHQDWLAGVQSVVSNFPSDRRREAVDPLVLPPKDLSAQDLHSAPTHQEWLSATRNIASKFPSKVTAAQTISKARDVPEPELEAEDEWGTTRKKSKKGKKDKKGKKAAEHDGGLIQRDLETSNMGYRPISPGQLDLQEQPISRSEAVGQDDTYMQDVEGTAITAQDSDTGSNVSDSTRERRKRRRSPPLKLGDDPEDLPKDRALTPPPEHEDVMDTALGVAAAIGFGADQHGGSREAPAPSASPHSDYRGRPGWSFANLETSFQALPAETSRDSGVQFDSPSIPQNEHYRVRDSGFVSSPPTSGSWQRTVAVEEATEGARRPTRPQSPTSSDEDLRTSRRNLHQIPGQSRDLASADVAFTTPAKRQPSPVNPTSKDRSSVLFQSSPAGSTPNKTPRSERRPHVDVRDTQAPASDLHRTTSIHGHQHKSREELRQTDGSPSTRRLSNELASNLLNRATISEVDRSAFSPSPNHSLDRHSPSKTSLHPIQEGGPSNSGITSTTINSRDDPTSRGKSLGKSKSRTNSLRNLRGTATSPFDPSNFESGPSRASAHDIDTSGVAPRERDMAEIYDGYGAFPGSPMSPTRPPSVRKRQSMQQIRDLEAKVDQLASENRSLAEAKIVAERHLQEFSLERSQGGPETERALQAVQLQLQERDQEIVKLRGEIASLVATHETLQADHNQRYSLLQDEHTTSRTQWEESTRELEGLRSQHAELSNGMEDIVRHEIDSALALKNAEIQKLRSDLESARLSIRELQSQILARGAEEVVVVRDEDYFDNACQQLCQHVQQWVLRYSKFSDTRVCRGTSEVRDEKIVDRFDNAILDGSDVDLYLADRVKRRDVFMSVVMTMIWEYVFTRYLFGMDRDQRQKLKQLEKNLAEVGPSNAVHQWRALTLTLLAKREAFRQQCDSDTEAVVLEILKTLSKFLPPPQNLEQQIHDSLRKVMRAAVDLSVEMRTQKAEYIMLPPLQPEYDTNGDLARKVFFNASLMNERSGETTSNEELEDSRAVVRIVLFPLVVKKGDDGGHGDEEIVVCPAQVLVARPDKGKRPKSRIMSGGSVDNRSLRAASTHSLAMSGVDMTGPGNMI